MGLFNFKKDRRFFTEEDFEDNFPSEISTAISVYEQLLENGFKENALAQLDYTFSSNTKEKLAELSAFLQHNYKHTLNPVKKESAIWIVEGKAPALPFDEEALMYWAIDLYHKGFEMDCMLIAYGAMTDENNLTYLAPATAEQYFDNGLKKIDERNFGEAIIYLTHSLKLDANNEEAYQARGYCKDELQFFKNAREDYDKAIEIDPNYVEALLLRGANFDDNEELAAAIADYNKVIELEPDNGIAFYNRGNSKFGMGNKNGACSDWKVAVSLGVQEAQVCVNEECN
jgi:tetratricopeptide (TPR) repeat protein